MNYLLLLVILIILVVVSLKFLKLDVFNPIMIAILCYIVGVLFCIIMIPVWKYTITFKSIAIVSVTFVFLILTSLLGQVLSKRVMLKDYNDGIIYLKEHSLFKKIIIFMVTILFSISIIKNYVDIAYKFGFSGEWYEFTELSLTVKNACLGGQATLLRLNTYLQYFLKGITYCSIFLFVYNVLRCKKDVKSNIYLLGFAVPYLLVIYVSGWRTDFLFILVYTLMMIGLNIDKSKKEMKNYVRYILIAFLFFIVTLVFWIFTVVIRYRDSFKLYDILNYISTYIGGGIVNFDQYLNETIIFPSSNVFGKRVFVNIYTYMNRLHLTNVAIPSSILPTKGVLKTNIYSGLFRGYDDFGLIGNCIYLGIIFFIYSFVYTILCKYKNLHFLSILYAYHCYPICLMGVEEAFSIFFISTMPLYVIVFYGITFYFMIYKSIKQRTF